MANPSLPRPDWATLGDGEVGLWFADDLRDAPKRSPAARWDDELKRRRVEPRFPRDAAASSTN